MTVSIHQPNFMPWEAYFEKIRQSDRFVLLGHCQYEKGKYQNRFQYHGRWMSMGVKYSLGPIIDQLYSDVWNDWNSIKRRLPARSQVLSYFDPHINASTWQTNQGIIISICRLLGIKTEIVFDYPTPLLATARLVDLCRCYGATTYLAGTSGRKYLDLEQFKSAGIAVEFQDMKTASTQPIIDTLCSQKLPSTA